MVYRYWYVLENIAIFNTCAVSSVLALFGSGDVERASDDDEMESLMKSWQGSMGTLILRQMSSFPHIWNTHYLALEIDIWYGMLPGLRFCLIIVVTVPLKFLLWYFYFIFVCVLPF